MQQQQNVWPPTQHNGEMSIPTTVEEERERAEEETEKGGLVRGNGDGPRTVSDRSDLAAREKLSSSARCVLFARCSALESPSSRAAA
jgi:hypothetical protein